MAYYQPRVPLRFTSSNGSTINLSLPLAEFEYESEQGLYVPTAPLTGAHYAYRQIANMPGIKQNGHERIRAVVYHETPAEVDTEIDSILAGIWQAGLGKLWAEDSAGNERWAWASAAAMPSIRWAAGQNLRKTVSLDMERFSDWYGETAITGSEVMNGASEAFNITNTGNARVFNAVFILKGTFVDPVITNTTNGYILESLRDGSAAGHWLRFDAGARRVELSTNGGTSYLSDYEQFVRQAGQVHLMILEAGVNAFTITFGGTPSGTFDYSFYPAFH